LSLDHVDIQTYKDLIHKLREAEEFVSFSEVVEHMKTRSIQPDNDLSNFVLNFFSKYNDAQHLQAHLKEVLEDTAPLNSCVALTLAKFFGKNGDLESLSRLLGKIRNLESFDMNLNVYDTLIQAFRKCGDMNSIRTIWADLLHKGFDPDLQVYNSYLQAFIENEELKTFRGILIEMMDKKIPLNSFNLDSLSSVFWVSRDYESLKLLFEEVKGYQDFSDYQYYVKYIRRASFKDQPDLLHQIHSNVICHQHTLKPHLLKVYQALLKGYRFIKDVESTEAVQKELDLLLKSRKSLR